MVHFKGGVLDLILKVGTGFQSRVYGALLWWACFSYWVG